MTDQMSKSGAGAMRPYGWRDQAVAWLANQVLRLASRRYRLMIAGSVEYGLRSAARDEAAGEPLPPLPGSAYPPGARPLPVNCNVTVNAPPGTRPAQLGKEIVARIREYERRGGNGWRG